LPWYKVKRFPAFSFVSLGGVNPALEPFVKLCPDQHHAPTDSNMSKVLGPGFPLPEGVRVQAAAQNSSFLETNQPRRYFFRFCAHLLTTLRTIDSSVSSKLINPDLTQYSVTNLLVHH
jgi:hypothetical protein